MTINDAHERLRKQTLSFAAAERASVLKGTTSLHTISPSLTFRELLPFFHQAKAVARTAADVSLGSSDERLVLSVILAEEQETSENCGRKRGRDDGGPPAPPPSPELAPKRAKPDACVRGGPASTWLSSTLVPLLRRLGFAKAGPDDNGAAYAWSVIEAAHRAALAATPPVQIDAAAMHAARLCVERLRALRTEQSLVVVQQLAVSVNSVNSNNSVADGADSPMAAHPTQALAARCPKLVVVARLVSGVAIPISALLHAVSPAMANGREIDGVLTMRAVDARAAVPPTALENALTAAGGHGGASLMVAFG